MLDNLRRSLGGVLDSLGRGAARVVPRPTFWTVVGVFFALLAFVFYGGKHPAGAGLFLAASGFFDVLDGSVARSTGRASKGGAFLDSTLDRVSEVMVYAGIVLGGYLSPLFVLLALSFSLLVSYTRARADALGINLAGVGIGERSERLIVLIVGSILSLVALSVLLVLVLALVTFVQRTVKVSRALAKPRGEG